MPYDILAELQQNKVTKQHFPIKTTDRATFFRRCRCSAPSSEVAVQNDDFNAKESCKSFSVF